MSAFINWVNLQNPILQLPDAMLKDQAVIHHKGYFYIFASLRIDDARQIYPQPYYFFKTRDFQNYTRLTMPGATHSPDIVYADGLWHQVAQAKGHIARHTLYLQTAPDLETWSEPTLLVPDLLQPGVRKIDGVLAKTGDTWHLGYKGRQQFYVIHTDAPIHESPLPRSAWRGPTAASADGEWAENYQWLNIDGTWHMLATAHAPEGFKTEGGTYTGDHEPYLYTMDGDGSQDEDWTRWRNRQHLIVPTEDWNTAMRANSAYLADWRDYDGYFYLFYAGANDGTRFQGRGHGKIGVARSQDLKHWTVPGNT